MTSLGTRAESATANGCKRVGTAGAIVLALVMALGIGAAGANAAPLSMQFTEARANVGIQLDDEEPLFQAPATAPFAAEIDPGSGSITEGILQVPQFSTVIDTPINALVTVDFDIGEIEGTFDQANGALSLTGTAGGTLTADDERQCYVSVPGLLTLTTSGSNGDDPDSRSGVPFTKGLTGPGAIAGTWDDMTAEPVNDPPTPDEVSFCNNVEDYIGGSGGIWIEHDGDVVPPAAPQLSGTNPASPSQNGTPRILGAAEAGSTVTVYASADCSGAPIAMGGAAELASPGIAVSVPEGATATFSAAATDAIGNVSPCSTPISYTHTKKATPVDPPKPQPKPKVCVVPKLAGKTLKRAKAKLKAADCKLGTVTKPKKLKAKKGKKRPTLVVRSSTPRKGARPADRKVDLKLGTKPRKKARR
jgi:hypothetical protein